MPARHSRPPLPRRWLLTDERQGAALWPALRRLPRDSGVIVRHYALSQAARAALVRQVRRATGPGPCTVLLAGSEALAQRLGADGSYGSGHGPFRRLRIAPAHHRRELAAARRAGASAVLLSPVFPTRSHPGAGALGPVRFGLIARQAGLPVFALGGMTAARALRLPAHAAGWAAIDGWAMEPVVCKRP